MPAYRARTRAVKICTIIQRTTSHHHRKKNKKIRQTRLRSLVHHHHTTKHLFWYVHLGITIGKPVRRTACAQACVCVHSNGSPSTSTMPARVCASARACLPFIVMLLRCCSCCCRRVRICQNRSDGCVSVCYSHTRTHAVFYDCAIVCHC